MNTINQEDTLPAENRRKASERQNHSEEESGSRPYIPSVMRMKDTNVRLSKTARTSSRIMKTEVLIREPYTITIITRLFNVIPIPLIATVVIM